MTPERFHEIRKSKGYTQEQLAVELEVTRLTIGNWENAKYQIPADIEAKMIALTGATTTEDPGAFITRKNHPECYVGDSMYYTLAHPRWYSSADCELRHLVPESAKQDYARVVELATYIPPTPEKVVELFLQHWPTPAAIAKYRNSGWMHEVGCKQWLARRGYEHLLHLIPHDTTLDQSAGTPYTPEEKAKAAGAIEALNASFANLTPNQDN